MAVASAAEAMGSGASAVAWRVTGRPRVVGVTSGLPSAEVGTVGRFCGGGTLVPDGTSRRFRGDIANLE